jgi:catechol 2,3-dioxygenase-like lactoylglutathione lyase family enzyme
MRFPTIPPLLALLLVAIPGPAQTPARPRITGISHVAYFVSDLPKALVFWHDFLGFNPDPGSNTDPDTILKINDHQYIELLNSPPTQPKNYMSHISFLTDNVEQMRAYLRAKGVEVLHHAAKNSAGDLAIEIKDPDGTLIEFEQPQPTGIEARTAGKFLPATRISQQLYHAGFLVGNSQRSLDFYGNILGFRETWRGTRNPAELSWITMRVPDGVDYVEFMLYRTLPATYGTSNHVALSVPSIDAAAATLKARPAFATYAQPIDIHTGVNGKRQFNLFDPDGTRVELMEPFTATGKPSPSSPAPPPPPSHP